MKGQIDRGSQQELGVDVYRLAVLVKLKYGNGKELLERCQEQLFIRPLPGRCVKDTDKRRSH